MGRANVEDLKAFQRAMRLNRVVILLGDNDYVLEAIKEFGPGARGVGSINDKISDAELDAMHRGGMRGVRLVFGPSVATNVARQQFQSTVGRIKRLGWHVCIALLPQRVDEMKDLFMDSPVPVVLDHFACLTASRGVMQPGFEAMVDLLRKDKVWVKVSAPYLLDPEGISGKATSQPPDFPDVVPVARALIAANPRNVMWGTDWPHPPLAGSVPVDGILPFRPADDGRVFNQFPVWVPDPAQRKLILVDNPARLYGF